MITLHMGMPKTGTTGLQHALAAAEDGLRASGLDYAPVLRSDTPSAHHDLPRAYLAGKAPRQAARQALLRHVRRSGAERVLISSEGFINLFRPGQLPALLRLTAALAALRPVTLVLSLRRIDDFFLSMYLHQIKVGTVEKSLEAYLAPRPRWIARFFAAIAELRDAGTARLETPTYRSGAGFLEALYPVLGLTPAETALLPPAGRSNAQLGLKAQTLLFALDGIAGELGVTVPSRRRLVSFLEDTPGLFDQDLARFDLMAPDTRRLIRDTALRAAETHGVTAYLEAFSDPMPKTPTGTPTGTATGGGGATDRPLSQFAPSQSEPAQSEPAQLDPALLTPADRARLVEAGCAAGVLVPCTTDARAGAVA